MKILVTNDDGVDSAGLKELAKSLRDLGDIFVAAPASQQSATGHALTIENPLRVHSFNLNGEKLGVAVNGTPSDSVKLALSVLLDEKPDLVVSGINFGRNTSVNILYSGTVAAATEGMLLGIPSIAISMDSFSRKADPKTAAEYAKYIVSKIKEFNVPKDAFLNVNIPYLPKEKIKGFKITKLSDSFWKDHYEKRVDPFGREYYWFSGEYQINDDGVESDDSAINLGYVSITPISLNFTNRKFLGILKEMKKTFDDFV